MQYIISNNSLTFYDEDGTPFQVRSDHVNYAQIRQHLLAEDADVDYLAELADNVFAVQTHIEKMNAGKYLEKGTVRVNAAGVYYNDELVDTTLTERMLRMLHSYRSIQPWVSFMEKLYTNPNHTTRFELYDWLRSCNLPLTEDGDFIGYKKVNKNYKDFYTGTMSNRIGMTVSLPDRSAVDPVRTNTCSRGLHFCSGSYLQSYHGGSGRVMIVKINPADVVSIPTDYNFAKGRTWRYEVVGEVTEPSARSMDWPDVVNANQYSLRLSESERSEFHRDSDYSY